MGQNGFLRSVPTLYLHDPDFFSEKQIFIFYQVPCFFGFSAFVFQASIDHAVLAIPLFFTSLLMQSSARNCFFNSYSIPDALHVSDLGFNFLELLGWLHN